MKRSTVGLVATSALVLTWLLAAGLVPAASAGPAKGAGASPAYNIPFEKYELPNGLDVILHEDHSVPMVAVNIWYHVGSKNEKPGRTGFAHLFEHMMFQGSQHHDAEYFEPLEKVGGRANGSTSQDRTNYWENVPPNYLELALWLESDRMGFLLPAMTQEKLDNQRDVVKNEKRQRIDNEPYGKAEEIVQWLLYPVGHPYSWSVIGSMEDLTAASMEDVQDFFRTYYAPNNASLCIAGDFQPAEAKRLVEKYFAAIPPGPPVDRMTAWIPELPGVKRVEAEDNVQLPRLFYIWQSPAYYAPGDAECDILGNVLSNGKTSRLYRALVYEQGIAQDVSAYQDSGELGSVFRIEVTAKEGRTLDEVERAADAELARLVRDGITRDELQQAQNGIESGFVRSLQAVGGFGGKADILNRYNTYLGDPGKVDWDMGRYRQATVAGVSAVARNVLQLDRRGIIRVVPQGELAAAEAPELASWDRTVTPTPGPEAGFQPPAIQRDALANGLELYVVEKRGLPLVQANLVVKSGWASDPPGRFGAGALTAELLDEGTTSRNALAIGEEAKRLGAQLYTGSQYDGSNVSLNVLRKNLEPGLALLADVALHPTFPAEELERQRQIYLGRIGQEAREPMTSAFKTFQRELYGPENPYAQPFTGSGTDESIKALRREDLVGFYHANYYPNNAALIMVGDLGLAEARAMAEKVFGGWKRGEVVRAKAPAPPAVPTTRICIVDKPGAPQSVIMAGHAGLRRADPDYLVTSVMNNALGGQFTSRINMNLREDKGFTYGARSFLMGFREAGTFAIFAPVQSPSTAESVSEILKEMREIMGPRPLTPEELTGSKDNLAKKFPQDFQTVQGIAGQLQTIVLYDLPRDEWNTYAQRVAAVDAGGVSRAASGHLHPDGLVIVVVGDRAKIEEPLRQLHLGEVTLLSAM